MKTQNFDNDVLEVSKNRVKQAINKLESKVKFRAQNYKSVSDYNELEHKFAQLRNSYEEVYKELTYNISALKKFLESKTKCRQ